MPRNMQFCTYPSSSYLYLSSHSSDGVEIYQTGVEICFLVLLFLKVMSFTFQTSVFAIFKLFYVYCWLATEGVATESTDNRHRKSGRSKLSNHNILGKNTDLETSRVVDNNATQDPMDSHQSLWTPPEIWNKSVSQVYIICTANRRSFYIQIWSIGASYNYYYTFPGV